MLSKEKAPPGQGEAGVSPSTRLLPFARPAARGNFHVKLSRQHQTGCQPFAYFRSASSRISPTIKAATVPPEFVVSIRNQQFASICSGIACALLESALPDDLLAPPASASHYETPPSTPTPSTLPLAIPHPLIRASLITRNHVGPISAH